MKLKKVILSLALYLPVTAVSQAQLTTLDWQFGNGDSLVAPSISGSALPAGAGVTATIEVGNTGSYSQHGFLGEQTSYGTPTGIWAIDAVGGGQIQLSLNAQPAVLGGPLTYSLQIVQFYDSFYEGLMSVSPGNPTRAEHLSLETVPFGGAWFRDTYTWQSTPGAGPLSLTISPSSTQGSGILVVDQVQWKIEGALAAVPEPALAPMMAAVGLAIFGLWRLRRREAKNLAAEAD